VLAIEFFESDRGLFVNEIALRPHNTGHWTIEGARTSQFTNHLLAVSGRPLGSTEPIVASAVMVNVVGADEPGSIERAGEVPGRTCTITARRGARGASSVTSRRGRRRPRRPRDSMGERAGVRHGTRET